MIADKLADGVVTLQPGVAAPLPVARKCLAVTIWNRSGCDLGIGGADVATDQMLPDGGSFRVAVRSPCMVYLFTRAPSAVEVAFTIEE